jgi:hypothetical protein
VRPIYLGLQYWGLFSGTLDANPIVIPASPPRSVSSQSRFCVPDDLLWAPNVTTRFAGSRSLALRPKAVAIGCQDFEPRRPVQMARCTVHVASAGISGGASTANTTAAYGLPPRPGQPAPYRPYFLRCEPDVDLTASPPLRAPMKRFALPPGWVMELKFELVDTPAPITLVMDDFAYDLMTRK